LQLEEMISAGFVSREGDKITTTPKGRPLLNAVLRQLLA
jgi:hypothetical protein